MVVLSGLAQMAQPRTLRRARTLPPTTPLLQRVGGHAGVHVTEDESLLLKPALPREVYFYQLVRDATDPATGLHLLKPWTPKFFGLLNLEGKLADLTADGAGAGPLPVIPLPALDAASTSGDSFHTETLVLQNLLHGYSKPCVLDVKLGTILYDQDASDEKKARMIRKAAETTSLETGMRLTGFQVYSNHAPDPVVYGKVYGYGLKPEQLQDGIRNFFPCSAPAALAGADPRGGLPADTLLALLTSLHACLADLRTAFSAAHLRMVGGSVLLVYEADWERAAAASGRGGGPSSVDDEVAAEDDDDTAESDQIEIEIDERGEIVTESIPDGASETSASSSGADVQARLYTVSLIDFAHTRVVPGEGPDCGVLLGIDTLIGLVARRKEEVAALITTGGADN